MDDDFVLGYVKANRMNEYRSHLDYVPDFDYIMFNYRFEKDEWLPFVKKFKRPFLELLFNSFDIYFDDYGYFIEQINAQLIAYLLENRALSVQDAIDFLNILVKKVGHDDYVFVVISHLLDNGCKINAEWVAKAIHDDGLIERIKEKQTFTFSDIHKARSWDSSAFGVEAMEMFYARLQKHFFDAEFENPFDDLHVTKRIRLDNQEWYRYKNVRDELSHFIEGRPCSSGCFPEMMTKSLGALVREYIQAVEIYDELDEKLADLIAEYDRKIDAFEDDRGAEYQQLLDDYEREIDGEAEPQRDEQGAAVVRVYFAISMK